MSPTIPNAIEVIATTLYKYRISAQLNLSTVSDGHDLQDGSTVRVIDGWSHRFYYRGAE